MKEFLREKFLFLIDKEEKEYIRQKVMNRDHKTLQVILCIIALLELCILLFSLFGGEPIENMGLEIASRALYINLICVCVICACALEFFKRKGKTLPYFIFVTLFTFTILIWGVGMSIIVSFNSFSLLYYVLTIIAASALICLEPWVETLCSIFSTVLYFVLYYSLDGVVRTADSIFVSGVLLALIISLTCFYFNFYRRIKAISLELQIIKLNAILDNKANTDALTGMNNRLFLHEKLENSEVIDFTNGGVMMCDLDHFKRINDTYGHLVGDKCLSEIGKIIKQIFNEKDENFTIRYGGEEFLIYVNKSTKKELLFLAETLRKTVENNEVKINDNQTIKYTISIGLSLGKGKDNFQQLITESDEALYKAKETRNTVTFLN